MWSQRSIGFTWLGHKKEAWSSIQFYRDIYTIPSILWFDHGTCRVWSKHRGRNIEFSFWMHMTTADDIQFCEIPVLCDVNMIIFCNVVYNMEYVVSCCYDLCVYMWNIYVHIRQQSMYVCIIYIWYTVYRYMMVHIAVLRLSRFHLLLFEHMVPISPMVSHQFIW